MGMESEEVPARERELLEGHPQRPGVRRLDEIRAEAAARRAKFAKRRQISEGIGLAVTVVFLALVAICSLAVVAAIIGGAYWLLTGDPIFG